MVFFVLEAYFQLNYRFGAVLPDFMRVYDFRYIDQEGTPRFPQNFSAWHKSYAERPDVMIHINSQGFRGREPLPSPSKRIVMIGDSTVFNGGVEEEETFPALVEASLHQSTGDSGIEVLNFGVSDMNARQYALKFKNHALSLKPDLAIVFIYLNDSVDTVLTSFDSPHDPERSPGIIRWLMKISQRSRVIWVLFLMPMVHRDLNGPTCICPGST